MSSKHIFILIVSFMILDIHLGSVWPQPIINKNATTSNNTENLGQERAGIADILPPNPINNSNLLPQLPFSNIFNSTQSQNDLLRDVKLFFVTLQGAVMPANVITQGFTNLLQGLGNMGNIASNLQNPFVHNKQ